jgi:hypothetical protein
MMYYFLPKAANRPVFSYRLSIIHFWGLIFIYIWAGPHHLLYTALPDWAQSLGMVFSVMLVAPSWGGMLNGLLTLRGAWDKVRQEPMLKFMVVAITAYGMATLEGPTLAIKSVNALSHYTDWTIAHVHTGALGWNGFLTFSMLYWLFPRLYNTKLWSTKLANYHFWIGLLGMMFYVIPMYTSGITQGLMWKQFNKDGFLQYPNFLETTIRLIPMHELRAIGGEEVGDVLVRHGDLRADLVIDDFLGEQFAPNPFAHVGRREAALRQLLLKGLVGDVLLGVRERGVQLALGHLELERSRLGQQDLLKDQIVEETQFSRERLFLRQRLRAVAHAAIGLVDGVARNLLAIDDCPRVGRDGRGRRRSGRAAGRGHARRRQNDQPDRRAAGVAELRKSGIRHPASVLRIASEQQPLESLGEARCPFACGPVTFYRLVTPILGR